jgi:SpoVK/Ycf46/Vps4 family AAA+-type ATPase
MVCSEILDARSTVAWEDIAGQEQAKRLVQELVVWPMLNPHLFKVPPRSVLASLKGQARL